MNKPNVIIIYADDLGYGDLSCYGAEEIHTPNIDKLLDCGIKFNSGYSTSAVCTPARYSLLTGSYPFRNQGTRILPGNATCIISKSQQTLPKMFKSAGYTTGIVGKWHLGLGDGTIDWNAEIDHTPNDIGFDSSFIFPATNDRVPCVYLKNKNVVNLDKNDPIKVCYEKQCPYDDIDTYKNNPEKLSMKSTHGHDSSIINGIGRIGFMQGGASSVWKDEDLAETFLGKAKDFVHENKENPFFLFYALHQPHVPRVASKKFKGATSLGPRGDVIAELDWCVGEMVEHLQKNNLLDNTIIIFSSDNGPVLDDGYLDEAIEKLGEHKPAGGLRGGKYSKFDGGARVPLIVSWKNHISSKTTDEILCQTDFFASFADMLSVPLEEGQAQDSENMLDLILGKNDIGRKDIMFESIKKGLTLRTGKWEYLAPSEGDAFTNGSGIETGNSMDPQLYNLSYDKGQKRNVAYKYKDIAKNMDNRINEILNSTTTR